ncbi:MAG TPA: two-component regulator propeller domain-containing protein [Pedobacter sp.]|uniref:two-component regulator propeller domain-containing protein n=1 Tax=Pedobacter sp. TaxID=1411316 RepID=UPI002BF92CB8|nr:two-component regulator propeller domain-containing protein [Pedobacter sp.]HMI03134.1 two-component regulator propeller domain-containing protein [Pedobacter sp.]
MKYIHVYTLFLMSVFLTSCGQSQTNAPKDNIKSEIKDIGPNIMVRNIKKGRNGTILIAGPNNSSFGDVFRYDGKSFTNLTNKIGSHRFWDVLEDRRGNIWFTSTDSGVYYYNGKSIQHFTTTEGLANNRVMSVYEDKAGIIWFGTGGGVSRYDRKSFRNFKNPNPSRVYKGGNWNNDFTWNNDITTIIEDKTGKLWVGTRGDAFVFDGKTFTPLIHKGKTFTNVWSIIEDRKGNIWLGDVTNGLWRYDGSTFTWVSQKGAYTIIEDKKGNIWTTGPVNTAHVAVWALSRYDAKSLYSNKPTVVEIMLGDAFLGLLEANDGGIWFGSATGVYRYDGKTITDFYNKEGQKKYIIDTKQSVVIWKGSMLLGAWEGSKFLGDGSGTGDVDILKGELLIENRHLVGGAVEVDMNTIEQKFDDPGPHNKLPAFFDVKKFPVSTFSITKVETGSDGKTEGRNGNMTIEAVATIKVTGNLTIEGITKAVTFPANMLFKDGMDGTVVMNGTLIIDRTDWGIDYASEKHFAIGDGTISDDVKLFMKIVATERTGL